MTTGSDKDWLTHGNVKCKRLEERMQPSDREVRNTASPSHGTMNNLAGETANRVPPTDTQYVPNGTGKMAPVSGK
jgi:hypothetical protein